MDPYIEDLEAFKEKVDSYNDRIDLIDDEIEISVGESRKLCPSHVAICKHGNCSSEFQLQEEHWPDWPLTKELDMTEPQDQPESMVSLIDQLDTMNKALDTALDAKEFDSIQELVNQRGPVINALMKAHQTSPVDPSDVERILSDEEKLKKRCEPFSTCSVEN